MGVHMQGYGFPQPVMGMLAAETGFDLMQSAVGLKFKHRKVPGGAPPLFQVKTTDCCRDFQPAFFPQSKKLLEHGSPDRK